MMAFQNSIRIYIYLRYLLTIAFILGMGLIMIFLIRRNIQEESEKKSAAIARAYNAEIKHYLSKPLYSFQVIHTLIHETPLSAQNDRERFSRYLENKIGDDMRYFKNILIIDRDGMEKMALPYEKQAEYFDRSSSSIFTEAIRTKKPVWSPTFVNQKTGSISAALSLSFDSSYVISADLDLMELRDQIKGLKIIQGTFVAIVDGNGTYISHPDTNLMERRELDDYFLNFRESFNTNSGRFAAYYNKKKYMVTAEPIDDPFWTVLVYTPISEIYRTADNAMHFLFLIIGFVIILSILYTRQITNTLSGIFNKFLDQAREITRGNYYLNMQPENLREFNELAEQFNKMSREIQSRERAILIGQSRYRSLFDNAAVSIIEFDFSGIMRYIKAMKEDGVMDFRTHFQNNPDVIRSCFESILVIDMNRSAMEFLNISNHKLSELDIPSYFTSDSMDVQVGLLMEIIEGKTTFDVEIPVLGPSGNTITIIANGSTVPGYEKNLSRVIFSFLDVTDRKLSMLETDRENRNLREMVESAVNELREKDRIMLYQSRMAAMGEMLRNIAHQWRQPLNALGISIQNTQNAYLRKQLNAEYLKNFVDKSMNLILHMSKTIDDFRNFFRPDKEPSVFSLKETVQKALSIIEASYANNFIRIETVYLTDMEIRGYPNEYSQVLLVILNNAKDILTERKIVNPLVRVTLQEMNGKSVVSITDNGGGIEAGVIMKIFEPYFTTKPEGTGIGLYMSKMIIESNMGGKLTVQNVEGGAEFRIVI